MKRVVLIVAVTLLGLFEFNKTSVAAYYEGVKTEGADVDSLNGGNLLYEESLLDRVIDFEPYYSNVREWYGKDGKVECPILEDRKLWGTTVSYRERCRLFAIPQEIIDNCDTEELMQLVLQCDLNYIINMYGTFEEGMKIYYNSYNGLRKLMERNDCVEVVMEYYEDYQIPKEKEFDYSMIPQNLSIDEANERAAKILKDDEYAQQINNDTKVKYTINICEWILSQKNINCKLNSAMVQNIVEIVANKSCELEDTEFAESTEEYFLNSIVNNPNQMQIYAPYIVLASSYSNSKLIVPKYKTIYTAGGKMIILMKEKNPTVKTYEQSMETLDRYREYVGKCVWLVENATSAYNCHAFAWFTMIPTFSKYAKTYQLNDPTPFMDDPKIKKLASPVNGCVISYGKSHSSYVSKINYTCNEARVYNDILITEKISSSEPLVKWPLKFSPAYEVHGDRCEYFMYYK